MLTIIAGPCSINYNNINEVEEILNIEINGEKVIAGTRCVGLKSRTSYINDSKDMGIDFEVFKHNQQLLIDGESCDKFEILPSIQLVVHVPIIPPAYGFLIEFANTEP